MANCFLLICNRCKFPHIRSDGEQSETCEEAAEYCTALVSVPGVAERLFYGPMKTPTVKSLTDAVIQVCFKPGLHSGTQDEKEVMRLCAEAGITVTEQDVRREMRAAAGFP